MSEEFVRKDVFEEHTKRMEEEDNRQNHRITKLELAIESISSIATSVEKLAVNMEHMVSELKDQGIRLKTLEDRDGDTWRKIVSYSITAILSIILGYLASHLGLD